MWGVLVMKKNKKLIIILSVIILIIIVFIGVLVSANISNSKEKENADKINFKFSDDYEYFDVSVDDFYTKIAYELKDNDIKTEELKKIDYDDVYDLYYMPYCEWNYAIDLSNNDRILLCSSNNGKTILSIGYDFTNNVDGRDAGFFIGRISKLFMSPNFDSNEFENKVVNDFLAKEETFDSSALSNARYVYNHLLYGIDTLEGVNEDGSVDEDSVYLFAIFAPVKEVDNTEWQENLSDELEQWQEDYENEQEQQQTEESTESNDNTEDYQSDTTLVYGYEKIYNDYSSRLRNECPALSVTECAEILTEGTEKMAEYMYSASGTDGQYSTYETWSGKLFDIYMQEVH